MRELCRGLGLGRGQGLLVAASTSFGSGVGVAIVHSPDSVVYELGGINIPAAADVGEDGASRLGQVLPGRTTRAVLVGMRAPVVAAVLALSFSSPNSLSSLFLTIFLLIFRLIHNEAADVVPDAGGKQGENVLFGGGCRGEVSNEVTVGLGNVATLFATATLDGKDSLEQFPPGEIGLLLLLRLMIGHRLSCWPLLSFIPFPCFHSGQEPLSNMV